MSERPSGVWRRRVVAPIVEQLTRGVTPEKIALSISLGLMLAIIPVLGLTTVLCISAAAWLGLNQPIILATNWLSYPLQLSLLVPFYRAGELFGAPHLSLSIPQLMARFKDSPLQFFTDFSGIALGGVAAWLIVAPLMAITLYFILLAPLRVLARRVTAPGVRTLPQDFGA